MLKNSEISRIRPMKDWVLVEVMSKQTATESGIILPERQHRLVNYATVLASGPGRLYPNGSWLPNQTKPGDIVYIANLGKCEPVQNEENRHIMFCAEPLIEGVVEEL